MPGLAVAVVCKCSEEDEPDDDCQLAYEVRGIAWGLQVATDMISGFVWPDDLKTAEALAERWRKELATMTSNRSAGERRRRKTATVR